MSKLKLSVVVMLSLVVAAASLVWLLPLVRNELVVEDSSIAGDEAGNLPAAIPGSHLGLERTAFSRLSQDSAGTLRVAALTRILQELPEEISRVSAAQQEALAA